jgi:hypothetical protein
MSTKYCVAHPNAGEKLKIKEIEGLGDQRYTKDGTLKKVDDGFSVKLSRSSEKYQSQNHEMLEAMFRKERNRLRKREKLEREAQEQARKKAENDVQ